MIGFTVFYFRLVVSLFSICVRLTIVVEEAYIMFKATFTVRLVVV